MSITIDDTPLDSGKLGFTTVGQILSHVARENKLVVQLLIDGSEPDFDSLRSRPIADSAIYIETAFPAAVCRDALDTLDEQLVEADGLRIKAAELFRKGDAAGGLPKLGHCFTLWHNAQDALGKVARLLKTDLADVAIDGASGGAAAESITAKDILLAFTAQLRQLKDALESRDYVLCCDVLTYDMDTASNDWKSAVAALRRLAV